MSFFSSITGGSKVKTPATGYYNLPKGIKGALNQYESTNYDLSQNPSLFTPAGFTPDQLQAFGLAQSAAAPTTQSIQDLVSPFVNANDDSVINQINKQATGANSTLNQQATAAGAFGGNRQALGANDIDESRLNEINTFKQGAYNTALQAGLGAQQQGISNLSTLGAQQQAQNTAIKQAPITANNNILTGASNFIQAGAGGSAFGSPSQTVSTGGGLGGILGGLSNAGSIFSGLGSLGSWGSAIGFGNLLGAGAGAGGLSSGALALAAL